MCFYLEGSGEPLKGFKNGDWPNLGHGVVLELGACSDEGGRLAKDGHMGCWCGEEGVWTRVVKLVTERQDGCMEGKKRRPQMSVLGIWVDIWHLPK